MSSNGQNVVQQNFRTNVTRWIFPPFNQYEIVTDTLVTVGKYAIFAGGVQKNVYVTDNVWIWDTELDTWSNGTLSVARNSICGASIRDIAIFAGGSTRDTPIGYGNWTYVTNVDIYNVTSKVWSRRDLMMPNTQLSSAVYKDLIFFGGGLQYSQYLEIFDYTTNSWSVQCFPTKRINLAMGVALNYLVTVGWASETTADLLTISKGSAANNSLCLTYVTTGTTGTQPTTGVTSGTSSGPTSAGATSGMTSAGPTSAGTTSGMTSSGTTGETTTTGVTSEASTNGVSSSTTGPSDNTKPGFVVIFYIF